MDVAYECVVIDAIFFSNLFVYNMRIRSVNDKIFNLEIILRQMCDRLISYACGQRDDQVHLRYKLVSVGISFQ